MKLFEPSACTNLLSSDLHRALRDALQPSTQDIRSTRAADADSSVLSDAQEDMGDSLGTSGVNAPSALLTSFLVQVTLCLRHAHRVLQATNSSLSRTLCCTVYVNLPVLLAMHVGAGSTAATAGSLVSLITEDQLVQFVRRMVAAMEQADGESQDAAGARAQQDGDDEFAEEDTQVL